VAEQITLTLPDDLARRVREVATLTHRELEEVLLEWLDHTSMQPPAPTLADTTEAQLLQQVNLGFSAEWWHHYRSLIADRQAETINSADLAELIAMSEALEMANIKRVEALGEIAQLRNCAIEQVMESLDINI
jgi:hypothetical protein